MTGKNDFHIRSSHDSRLPSMCGRKGYRFRDVDVYTLPVVIPHLLLEKLCNVELY